MERIFGKPNNESAIEDESHWLSVSDLMAGLMMVFLFISVALMLTATKEKESALLEKDKVTEIAVAYEANQTAIYDALLNEFSTDLDRWDAVIDRDTLGFEFRSPDVLFDVGDSTLRYRFKEILQDFFPRYVRVVTRFRESIDEIRLEGHTSSLWAGVSDTDAYFNNMQLSQGRTRSVLNYVYMLYDIRDEQDWIKRYVAAVGFSSSRAVLNDDGRENHEASRRVTFRVMTNADEQIGRILGR